MLVVMVGMFTMVEWVRWFRETPPNPFGLSVIFVIVCISAALRIIHHVRTLRNYDLGLIGERHIAEKLDALRENGYHIIHDIPCGRMNIDHVLIGPAGIFTIETKMARKQMNMPNRIVHSSHGVLINGKRGWGGKAVWEAEKEATYLRDILKRKDVKIPCIQPIVVYPGWYVQDDCNGRVWVLNDVYLVQKIRSLPSMLSSETITKIRRQIETYVREKTAELDYSR